MGKRLALTFSSPQLREVVGVIADVKLDGLTQTDANSIIYIAAHSDFRRPLGVIGVPSGLTLFVRTTFAARRPWLLL